MVDDKTREVICERHALDFELYSHAVSKFAAVL
jgi:hypothetical protein